MGLFKRLILPVSPPPGGIERRLEAGEIDEATVEVAEADLPVAMPLPDPVAMPRPDAAARRGILDVPDAVPASDFALALTAQKEARSWTSP